MKTNTNRLRRIVAAIAITAAISAGTASAQTQQNNQLALQLGAIQLGYTTNSSWTTNPQLLANALTQGQQALLATTTNKYTSYVVGGTNAPLAQTATFRDQLYKAALAALTSPITYTNKVTTAIPVAVVNGKTGKTTTNKVSALGFNPALTTPTAVFAIVTARIPNFDPGLISNAVAASFSYTTNSNGVVLPTWGAQPSASSLKTATNTANINALNAKTATAQLNNAAAVAGATLTATLKNYVTSGTKNWAGVSTKTGPLTNTTYLPNYSANAVGPTSNQVSQHLIGISSAAAAVAANAINGLGTNVNGAYGLTSTNVQTLTTALIKSAAAFQTVSTGKVNGTQVTSIGALGAASLGLVSQVAGTNNDNWGASTSANDINSLLQGIVSGAVKAAKSQVAAIAVGVAQGFAGTYLATLADPQHAISLESFKSQNTADLLNSFVNAGAFSLSSATYTSISNLVNQAFSTTYTAFGFDSTGLNDGSITPNIGSLTGAPGINNFGHVNGVGTPVTDTVGL